MNLENSTDAFVRWASKYFPYPPDNAQNLHDQYGGCLRSVNDALVAKFIDAGLYTHIWTLLECDGELYLAPSKHFVNREGYFLTAKPWSTSRVPKDIRL